MTAAHLMKLEASKDYATRENAIKAVQKVFGANHEHFGSADVRYVVVQGDNGCWFPLFIGESALRFNVHHRFNVAA